MNNILREGDRIRLKTRTLCGWKGAGTVLRDSFTRKSLVMFHADGTPPDVVTIAVRYEVSRLRDQSA